MGEGAVRQPSAPARATSTWPVVLGVLSIVAGYRAMQILGGGGVSGALATMGEVAKGDFSFLTQHGPWPTVCLGASLCAAASAVAGGVLLLRRRRSASWLASSFTGRHMRVSVSGIRRYGVG